MNENSSNPLLCNEALPDFDDEVVKEQRRDQREREDFLITRWLNNQPARMAPELFFLLEDMDESVVEENLWKWVNGGSIVRVLRYYTHSRSMGHEKNCLTCCQFGTSSLMAGWCEINSDLHLVDAVGEVKNRELYCCNCHNPLFIFCAKNPISYTE